MVPQPSPPTPTVESAQRGNTSSKPVRRLYRISVGCVKASTGRFGGQAVSSVNGTGASWCRAKGFSVRCPPRNKDVMTPRHLRGFHEAVYTHHGGAFRRNNFSPLRICVTQACRYTRVVKTRDLWQRKTSSPLSPVTFIYMLYFFDLDGSHVMHVGRFQAFPFPFPYNTPCRIKIEISKETYLKGFDVSLIDG